MILSTCETFVSHFILWQYRKGLAICNGYKNEKINLCFS